MKKFLMTIIALLLVFAIVGCGSKDIEEEETDVTTTMVYVGTYSKTTAMGETVGGHLLVFYSDNTVNIYSGMYSGMGGSSVYPFIGTYTLEDNELSITYYAVNEEEPEETTLTTTITDNSFRAQIKTEGGMPDDGLGETSGLNYYLINNFDIASNIDSLYVGSTKEDDSIHAYMLMLNTDLSFTLIYNDLTISGTYKINVKSLTESDELVLTYTYNGQETTTTLIYDTTVLDLFITLEDITTSVKSIVVINPLV